MRILVIGGAGYIGSHAARHFLQAGHEVWIYDNLSRGHADAARAVVGADSLLVGDLHDRATIEKLLLDRRIDAVVHFAALTYVGESVQEPETYYRNNVIGTLTLLEAMRRVGVQRIVFSSTAAVYGNPERVPITEDERTNPINPYGRTKLMIEWALADHAKAYGLGYAALRYFNAAGADPDGLIGEDHDPETHLIPIALQVAAGVRPHLEIYGDDYPTPDGTCIRDYVHVNDLAAAHLLALERLRPGEGRAFNLGTGTGNSVREIVTACEEVSGRRIPIKRSPRRPGDPAILVASADRANAELGWSPQFRKLEALIETAWRWHKRHPKGYAK